MRATSEILEVLHSSYAKRNLLLIEKQKKMPGRRLDDLKEAIEKIQQKQDAIQKELSTIEDLVDQNKTRIGGILDEVHDAFLDRRPD